MVAVFRPRWPPCQSTYGKKPLKIFSRTQKLGTSWKIFDLCFRVTWCTFQMTSLLMLWASFNQILSDYLLMHKTKIYSNGSSLSTKKATVPMYVISLYKSSSSEKQETLWLGTKHWEHWANHICSNDDPGYDRSLTSLPDILPIL